MNKIKWTVPSAPETRLTTKHHGNWANDWNPEKSSKRIYYSTLTKPLSSQTQRKNVKLTSYKVLINTYKSRTLNSYISLETHRQSSLPLDFVTPPGHFHRIPEVNRTLIKFPHSEASPCKRGAFHESRTRVETGTAKRYETTQPYNEQETVFHRSFEKLPW